MYVTCACRGVDACVTCVLVEMLMYVTCACRGVDASVTCALVEMLMYVTCACRDVDACVTTFYKILNNIIEITPPPGLLTRSRTHRQYVAPRCRINAMVFSFYPRAIRIWNMIPPKITNIKNSKSFQEAIMELPFTTPPHLNCL